MDISLLYGRRELVPKIIKNDNLPKELQILPTMLVTKHKIRCLRCNSLLDPKLNGLPENNFYCSKCITLGRVSTLDQFYHVSEPNQFPIAKSPLTWNGQLSSLQRQAADEVRISMAKHERRLLWAVTGAGKTEMTFPTINQALLNNERVCIASPRVDVCIELFPRLQKAFAKTDMILLHGRQKEPYRYTQLVVCTTHQLLRFYHAFDLLIVDEVDSFPYASNPRLLFATEQAKKKNGGLLLMTATPGKLLLKEVKAHQLAVSYLPLRYHRHLLPEIHIHKINKKWRSQINKNIIPSSLKTWINKHLENRKRFLLFVPHIKDLPVLKKALLKHFKSAFETLYAEDDQRLTKVQKMRDHEYQFLVTTTILERGVTFPEIDVCVLGAEEEIFSTSALVQIAGRVGRSQDCPTGDVSFFIVENAKNVQGAIKQIKYLNHLGKKLQKCNA